MQRHIVSVNGLEMNVETCGEQNERAIVLLHGFCGSSQYWHKVCPLLSEHYYVIMPQLRGHSASSISTGTYSMEMMADDIYEIIQHFHIDKCVMFGHSLGGYVALAFAEKYSDRLLGLGLVHSTALPDHEQAITARKQAITEIQKVGIEQYIMKLVPSLYSESKHDEMQEEIRQTVAIGLDMTPEGAIHTLEGMMERPDRSHVLIEAGYPILLVAGAEDQIIPPYISFSINGKVVTDSTFRYPHILENTFENVAHMSMLEVPNQLARVMANYLKTVHERIESRALEK